MIMIVIMMMMITMTITIITITMIMMIVTMIPIKEMTLELKEGHMGVLLSKAVTLRSIVIR